MFLAFPLDYQKDLFIRAAVAPFGRLLEWYRDDNRSRSLVQALILSADRVPRSLIISCGTLIGGMGRSWSVPVYILNGNFPNAFPADDDPVPFDGEPHPEHPPIVLDPNPQEPNWQDEVIGAANNLGLHGGQPHNQNQNHVQHNEDEDDDPEEEFDEEFFEDADGNMLNEEPQVQHQEVDLDLSGSSMEFLRANGPDIAIDEVFGESSLMVPLPQVMLPLP